MTCILSAGACVLMMVFPDLTVSATKAAIRIWMNAVVPSLMPFMIFAVYIKKTSVRSLSGHKWYPIIMAFLSGYPMGAKMAAEQYREGAVDAGQLYRTLCGAMITGPAFLIGGIGVTFYGSKMAGYILAFSHYAAAVSCSFILGRRRRIPSRESRERRPQQQQSDTPFTDCILESFQALGVVLAYIALFMIAAEFIDHAGWMEFLPETGAGFCKGILEMTVGCSELASCETGFVSRLVLSSFIISFGGLSVIGQTMSMLDGCPVTLIQVLCIKLIHGIISAIWTFTLCIFVV